MNQTQTVQRIARQHSFIRKTSGSMRNVCQPLWSRVGGTVDLAHLLTSVCLFVFFFSFKYELCVDFQLVEYISLFPPALLVMILSFYALYLTHCVGLRLNLCFLLFFLHIYI